MYYIRKLDQRRHNFWLKITHKIALPSIMLICFTSFCQLHNKPRQKHRKSSFLWSNFCSKWPKFTIRCALCFEGKMSLISPVYSTKHIIYQNLGKIWEMPCPTLFVERLLNNVFGHNVEQPSSWLDVSRTLRWPIKTFVYPWRRLTTTSSDQLTFIGR